VERMKVRGLTLLDVQVPNPHLATLGVKALPRRAFLERLKVAVAQPVSFLDPTEIR